MCLRNEVLASEVLYEGPLFFCTELVFVRYTSSADLISEVRYLLMNILPGSRGGSYSYRQPIACDNIFLSYEFIT